jgi:hypothetical protein
MKKSIREIYNFVRVIISTMFYGIVICLIVGFVLIQDSIVREEKERNEMLVENDNA